MVEIEVRLLRGSVYFAGEPIRCQITFTNTAKRAATTSSQDSRTNHVKSSQFSRRKVIGIETIAWASAQIHCQCTINDTRVQMPDIERNILQDLVPKDEAATTSFMPSKGERGRCLLSTKPKILFCDLTLAAGESKSYYYEDAVPFDSPPSYKGLAVKYCYKITVGAGRLQSTTKLVRLPVRILVLEGLKEFNHCSSSNGCSSNPFLNDNIKARSMLDVAVEKLTTITCKKSQYIYNVVNKDGLVGCFILFKSAYRIGDEILGIFDFRGCKVKCTKLIVTLQSEEHVCGDYKKASSKHLHSHTSYSTQQEFCLYSKKIQIQLPIPITATPEFKSDIVDVRWRLHFEFYLSTSELHTDESTDEQDTAEVCVVAPPSLNIETMTWDLPLKIVPCNPVQASAISLLRTTATSTF
ncbi:RAB6A-GEF complex partner protein 2-like [Dendronephthya gigantea]|uniref:RAB6A-GEF complex partner protein 2-like n=1 Tax=Dendronephthya gigantea TaxID=151771 RepID=UPI00106A2936|nr:RAB6A-GEF complex partner protein 2-like [Dendronephthya gigantea]